MHFTGLTIHPVEGELKYLTFRVRMKPQPGSQLSYVNSFFVTYRQGCEFFATAVPYRMYACRQGPQAEACMRETPPD